MTLDLKSLRKTHARVYFYTTLTPVSLWGWGFGVVFPPYGGFSKGFNRLKGGATFQSHHPLFARHFNGNP